MIESSVSLTYFGGPGVGLPAQTRNYGYSQLSLRVRKIEVEIWLGTETRKSTLVFIRPAQGEDLADCL